MDTFLSRIYAFFAAFSRTAAAPDFETLDGKVILPDGIMMLIAELACDGYVNPDIDDEHFPGVDPFVSSEGVVPVEIGDKDWAGTEALAFLDAMVPPMKPVMPDKGIKWAAENPDAQRENPLVIMGQKCRSFVGSECFLVLRGSAHRRHAYLYDVQSRFGRKYLVLAERKERALGT